MKNVLFLLLVLTSAVQAQSLSTDESKWIDAVNVFQQDAKQAGLVLKVSRDPFPNTGTSPVGSELKDGECIIVLQVRNNPMSKDVQELLPGQQGAAVARVAAIAHEFGHCVSPAQHSPEAEAQADAFALAWFKQNSPSNYEAARMFFQKLRLHATEKYQLDQQVSK